MSARTGPALCRLCGLARADSGGGVSTGDSSRAVQLHDVLSAAGGAVPGLSGRRPRQRSASRSPPLQRGLVPACGREGRVAAPPHRRKRHHPHDLDPAAADPERGDRPYARCRRAAARAAVPRDRAHDRRADPATDLRPRDAAHGLRPRGDHRRCRVRRATACRGRGGESGGRRGRAGGRARGRRCRTGAATLRGGAAPGRTAHHRACAPSRGLSAGNADRRGARPFPAPQHSRSCAGGDSGARFLARVGQASAPALNAAIPRPSGALAGIAYLDNLPVFARRAHGRLPLPRGDRMKRREFMTLLAGAAAGSSAFCSVTWPLAARAQQPSAPAPGFPNKMLRIIVPFTPGGANIAYSYVAKSPPDGHVMLIAPASFTMGPHLSRNPVYNPVTDFAAINLVADVPFVMVVPASLPVRTVKDFIALAKMPPNKLTFGSVGVGTPQHLGGELFKMRAGVDLVHVPFRGATAVLPDLVAGRIDMFIGAVNSLLPLIREGSLRALAATSLVRIASLPEVPTLSDAAFPGFEVGSGVGLVAPAATPPDIIETLNREIAAIIATHGFHQRMALIGVDVVSTTPAAYAKFISDDYAKWGKVVAAAGIKPE